MSPRHPSSGKPLGKPLDPYHGPTERESLEAIGTTPEEIATLAKIFNLPSGLDEDLDEDLDDEDLDDDSFNNSSPPTN